MSIRLMTMIFDRYPEGGSEMLLALAMADHASDDGTRIWPSVDELARKTRQSRRTVQRQIGKMVSSGWLELVSAATGRRGSTNEYRVSAAWVGGAELPTRGVNVSPPKDTDEDSRGDTAMTPESSGTIINHTPLPPDGGAAGFEQIFAIYPKQWNRAKAERRWRRMSPSIALQQVMRSAIEAQRLSNDWTKAEGRYVPEFASWLRKEGWRDGEGKPGVPALWDFNRSTIEAKAAEFGLRPWDENDLRIDRESFGEYTERVRRLVEESREAACV